MRLPNVPDNYDPIFMREYGRILEREDAQNIKLPQNGGIVIGSTVYPGTFTAGDTLYASALNTLSKLAIGAANKVYTSSGTAPQWSTNITYGALPTGGGTWANGGALAITGGSVTLGGNLILGANSITMTGSIASTGSRVTKGWFTDLDVTNAITGSVSGSAATLTTTRTIWGQNFNGSANVSGALSGATTINASGTITSTGGDVVVPSGNKIIVNGATGTSYFHQLSATETRYINIGNNPLTFVTADIFLGSTTKLYFNYPSGTAYLVNSGADRVSAFTSSGLAWYFSDTTFGINRPLDFVINNTYDLGATNAPRDVYVGRNLTAGGDFGVAATKKHYFDGVALTGDTYAYESSANVWDLFVGAANTFRSTATAVTITGTLTATGTVTIPTALTGIIRADAGVLSVATGVGIKTLFDHFADANNGTTVETDLYSDTIPAARLAANGEKLEAEYTGVFSGDATSTQQLKVYFGGTAIFDSTALAIGVATPSWETRVTISRVSASVVRCAVVFTSSSAALAEQTTYTEVTGLTLANTQVMKITGTAAGATGASNQITAKKSYVAWMPAA